ncbi:helix-turn-helix transcriptional regulator [Oscillospiraceae bacterium HV4-5-C5C]|nr:helix-turn-helix transcriptional regulator [Oscillospiraceae bacterium HV4-5-C5C]
MPEPRPDFVEVGQLLRSRRRKAGWSQQELCRGICTPSYLSKIETGRCQPAPELMQALFSRLHLRLESGPVFLEHARELMTAYEEARLYGRPTGQSYELLNSQADSLMYSRLNIDWRLIRLDYQLDLLRQQGEHLRLAYVRPRSPAPAEPAGRDWSAGPLAAAIAQEILDLLRSSSGFSSQQQIKLSLALRHVLPEPVKAILNQDYCYTHWLQNQESRLLLVAQTQGCSLSLLTYMRYLFDNGRYAMLQPWIQRAVNQALEEGNICRLTQVYILQGSAYACLNNKEMMLPCYTRALNLLRDSCFAEQSFILYYNIGATYLILEDWKLAECYLNKAADRLAALNSGQIHVQDQFLLYHKQALCYLRSGRPELARPCIRQMQQQFEPMENQSATGRLLTAADLQPASAPPGWLTDSKRLAALSVEALMYEACLWESLADGLKLPAFLDLMTVLLQRLQSDKHPGFVLFYQSLMLQALRRQRKYKEALELLSSANRYQ